jgi:hypothetical protein
MFSDGQPGAQTATIVPFPRLTARRKRLPVPLTASRALLLALAFASASTTAAAVSPRPSIDLSGHPADPLSVSDARAIVLVFVATDCPVSNRYVPEIERLQKEFAAAGVRFWFVYPNPGDGAAAVRAHDSQFSINLETVLDTAQTLVQRAHVTTTPEAAVFIPAAAGEGEGGKLREVYRGRIDDRYLSFGHERPRALHHDLEEAIRAVLANRPVVPPAGGPVGCAIIPLHL